MHPRVREEIKEALQPLLDLFAASRRATSSVSTEAADAYRPGERKDQLCERLGVSSGLVDPREMPFYVLLIGTPEEIPYSFQYQLDVMRGVGRLTSPGPTSRPTRLMRVMWWRRHRGM